MREFFRQCGKITDVRMPRWHDSGKPRGYAHVSFAGVKGARAAFGLDGKYMNGRYLTVQVQCIQYDVVIYYDVFLFLVLVCCSSRYLFFFFVRNIDKWTDSQLDSHGTRVTFFLCLLSVRACRNDRSRTIFS